MKNEKIIKREKFNLKDLIFLNKDKTKELTFDEWVNELDLEFIIKTKTIND